MTKRKLERKGFIWFILSYCCSFAKENQDRNSDRAGTWRQEQIQRPGGKELGEKCLHTVTGIILLLTVTGSSPNE